MIRYRQYLLLVLWFATVISAEFSIIYFGAYRIVEDEGNQSTIYTNEVELWAKVTDCEKLTPICTCTITTPQLPELKETLQFFNGRDELGNKEIRDLTANTLYIFELTCSTGIENVTVTTSVTTDYGRPLDPQNFIADIEHGHLELTWEPPEIPEAAFSFYRLRMNNGEPIQICKNETSYRTPEEYHYGTFAVFTLAACYVNTHHTTVCSGNEKSTIGFIQLYAMPKSITTQNAKASSTETPTTVSTSASTSKPRNASTLTNALKPKSNGVLSDLVPTWTLFVSLFLLSGIIV